jgi:very-short-patch-repair endonuclease
MPQAEVLLWARLKGRQLLGCKFRRQYSVGAFVLDFYSPEIKLGIELDGDSHFREGKREYDTERDAFIGSFGIKIVRFLNADVYENLDGVLEAIERTIVDRRATRGEAPSHSPPYDGGSMGGSDVDGESNGTTPPDPPFVRGGKSALDVDERAVCDNASNGVKPTPKLRAADDRAVPPGATTIKRRGS